MRPCLGGMLGFQLEKTPVAPAVGIWVWPQAPGEDSAGLERVSEKHPEAF